MFEKINKKYTTKSNIVFLDGCAGIGDVSVYACNQGYQVVSNDIMEFSSHIVQGITCLNRDKFKKVRNLIKVINNLPYIQGFFYHNYSQSAGRMYFTDQNAMKIDSCRKYIETIDDDCSKNYLLYCGLEELSRVQNTAGVQAAFLKKYKKSALNPYKLKIEWSCFSKNLINVYNTDILELLKSDSKEKEDILYIDPPYNERQYGPNYHLYETFVKYDNPIIKGKTGLRDWQDSKSLFCKKQLFFKFIGEIIDNTSAQYMFLNYNSDGFFSLDELLSFFSTRSDKTTFYKKQQKRFKSDTCTNRNYNDKSLEEWFFELKL